MAQPLLFTPIDLRGLRLRNRVVLSPMCQYQADNGYLVDWHFAHHGHFSLAGLGLAFVEATAVMRDGRITYGCTGLWEDGQIDGMRRVVSLYHDQGAACGIQLGHAGRRGSAERPWDGAKPIERVDGEEAAWQTMGPSVLPEREGHPAPGEMTVDDIAAFVSAFEAATHRALEAGFDTVEIHGAHGYLLHSFFSPVSNQRSDAYGGSIEGRMRLPLEISRAARAIWPEDKPLFYRVSSVDGVEGGLELPDTVTLAGELKSLGIDVVDCSSGGMGGPATLSRAKITPGYMVPYAEEVRREAGLMTMAVGAIIDAHQAEAVLQEGRADLIAIAREMMADASWIYRAAQELGLENPHGVLPPQYAFHLERRAGVLDREAL